MNISGVRSIGQAMLLWMFAAGAYAQVPVVDPKAEAEAAFKAANATMTKGPAEIKLADQAVLKIVEGHAFIPTAEAGRLLQVMGNRPGEGLLGLVMPLGKEEWFVVARNIKAGYIKDGDAKEWKADELLGNLKEGTEEVNEERRKRGIPEVQILGWVQAPTYDAQAHRLVWSLQSKEKGAPDGVDKGVNYNTYALGREGYISLNLVTNMSTIDKEKEIAHAMLASLNFHDGKRYGDFNSSTDKVAEYGLAALIGGVAAKKLGLLALIGAFLLKFWKLAAIAVVGFGAVASKFFGKKKAAGADAPPPPPSVG